MPTDHKNSIQLHFDQIAVRGERITDRQKAFHRFLIAAIEHTIPYPQRTLELGSGPGDLIATIQSDEAIGIDLSTGMVHLAQRKYLRPNLSFVAADAEEFSCDREFDTVIGDFLVNYLDDIQATLNRLKPCLKPEDGLMVLSIQNTLWRPLVWIGRRTGLAQKGHPHSWVSSRDMHNFLQLAGFEVIQQREEILWPFRTPLVDALCNRYLARLPLIRHLCASIVFTARPSTGTTEPSARRLSLIVPARNEAGHLEELLPRIPLPPPEVEIEVVLVEGNSTDDTWAVMEQIASSKAAKPFRIQVLRQSGKGKWNAVQEGIEAATGEICIIQDADLTAPPEDLSKFYEVLVLKGYRFASGSRLVYPMEAEAMRWFNLLGNRFFAGLVGFIIRRPIKDSLCGTKAFFKSDFERMKAKLPEIYAADPFGDFFLLFGASALQLRCAEIPIRYRARTYGDTNISRWSDGLKLLRLCALGGKYLRFSSLKRRAWDQPSRELPPPNEDPVIGDKS